ncbi:protein of unknown function [Tistlia consotensis]|uniref:DUF4376 domain-containing protein n=1 Tax=Tistlia consotensis USBA 355 TaxID=560819 RepID=A0A1Y6CYX7_9PROT|nr:DUF4376 domain-containing protein [Tistlia consotensis]SMF83806.1 protein of unknown function [Tistlia consotensis USBA 355]SNS34484.1 protein of unknown function [Tistlia consotensis]
MYVQRDPAGAIAAAYARPSAEAAEHLAGDDAELRRFLDRSPAPAEAAAREIGRLRDRRIARGFTFDFGNGEQAPVDTRNDDDRANLDRLYARALRLDGQGVTDPVIPFRDGANVTRQLTPQQMIALGDAALAHGEAQYQWSWPLKDAVRAEGATEAAIDAALAQARGEAAAFLAGE